MRHAGRDRLLPVQVRRRTRAGPRARPTRQCKPPCGLRQRHVRPQAAGRDLLRAPGVPGRLLRAGRLLPDELHRRLQVVRAHRVARHLHQQGARRHRYALRRHGTGELRHRRLCATATAPATATTPARRARRLVPGQSVDAGHRPDVRRPRDLPGGGQHRVRALCLQRRDGVPGGMHGRHRLPAAVHLRQADQPLRQQAPARPGVHDDRPVPDRQLLRRRRLLQQHVVWAVPGVQRGHQRRQLRAGDDGHARAARGGCRGEPAVRQHGRLQRRRRLPACGGHRVVRSGVVLGLDVHGAVALHGTGACAPRDRVAAARRTVRRRGLPDELHGGQRLRGAVHLPGDGAQPELRAEAERPARASAANQCISGNCVNGVCCGSPSCANCQACNLAGSLGTCARTCAAGAAAPAGQCAAAPPCGNTGACNGAGGCQLAAATVSCGLAHACSGSMFQPASFCSGSRRVQPDRNDELRRVRLQHQQHLPHELHVGRALREQQPLLHRHRHRARQPASARRRRRGVRRRPRVRQRLLHRRRLLQRRVLRAVEPAIDGSAGRAPTSRPAPRCRRDNARRLRRAATRAPATVDGGCQRAGAGGRAAPGRRAAARRTSRRHTATGGGRVHPARDAELRRIFCSTVELPHDAARRDADCVSGYFCNGNTSSARKLPGEAGGVHVGAGTSALAATASTVCAATRERLRRTARRAT